MKILLGILQSLRNGKGKKKKKKKKKKPFVSNDYERVISEIIVGVIPKTDSAKVLRHGISNLKFDISFLIDKKTKSPY